ncbi:MAG: hypothetical protein IJO13_09500, partial [Lachnospiraceae bacterium]|nr:hypothetical protein [Lachnospiraceae bacterium]
PLGFKWWVVDIFSESDVIKDIIFNNFILIKVVPVYEPDRFFLHDRPPFNKKSPQTVGKQLWAFF